MVRSVSTPDARLRKLTDFLLAFFWCAGIACGIMLSSQMKAGFLSGMRSALGGAVSIVGLLGIYLIPFLLSALAVFLSMPRLLYAICFCKAVTFAFAGSCVLRAYGCSGWLAGMFLLFSDGVGVPVLYLFWQRQLARPAPLSMGSTALLSCFLLLAAGFYNRIVSPFWVSLLF